MTNSARSFGRTLLSTFAALAVFAVALPLGAQTPAETAARETAERWLVLVDGQDYEASWNEAGRIFQQAVPQEQWTQQVSALREQVGEVESREFVAAESTTNPQGAPPGEYVNIQYRSEFSAVGPAVEVVVLRAEEERGWRVVGYFLQPPNGE